MLEAMVTLILVIVGVVLIIFILGYGIYITFYPGEKEVVAKKKNVRTSSARARRARTGTQSGTQKRGNKPNK